MRRTYLAAVLLAVPALAAAQDAVVPAPRPVGTLLLDALPAQADIVLDVPDLPGLLDAASHAGLGEPAAWRAAFDEQLRAWGAGLPDGEKLVRGGGALLAAADGEALFASMEIKLPSSNAPSVRATLFAMRSTQPEKSLRAALQDVIDGGLRYRYEGQPRTEEIAGRRVTALPGNLSTLYVLVQDGLVAASDHPLALGLFFRGLAREVKEAPAGRPPAGQLRLLVRHGRGEAAWEGWMWGEGESVQWPADKVATASLPTSNAVTSVFAVAVPKIADLPLSPVPLDDVWLRSISAYKPTDSSCVGIFAERAQGGGTKSQATGPRADVPGASWRLGWLRALSSGRIETPFAGVDSALLRGPYESAAKAAGDAAGEFVAWKATGEPGKLSGPLGHGPATFLALRALHDIGRGVAPREVAPKAPATPRDSAPLPPPSDPKAK